MINGVLNVYKEKGFTSHDVVARLRGIVGQKKIGHTGTLDPDATGVLPVCLGKATKLCDMLTDKNKTYETVMLLGKTTDTQDVSGTVISEKTVGVMDSSDIEQCILSFVGDYMQIPPMYSALKVNGKKLYELAREGIEIERKARPVSILNIKIKEINIPRISMEVTCSKGTYIRTLCHDIGEKLGCGACMEELTRTKVSRFDIKESLTLSQIEEKKMSGNLEDIIIPVDEMFSEYEAVFLKEAYVPYAYNGNTFLPKHIENRIELKDGKLVRVYNNDNEFIAIYKFVEDNYLFRIEKMFFERKNDAVH